FFPATVNKRLTFRRRTAVLGKTGGQAKLSAGSADRNILRAEHQNATGPVGRKNRIRTIRRWRYAGVGWRCAGVAWIAKNDVTLPVVRIEPPVPPNAPQARAGQSGLPSANFPAIPASP